MDLGRPLELLGPGDCEAVREKGLLRFCPGCDAISEEGFEAGPAEVGVVIVAKQHQAMES